jgi:glycosyltransferase involved in cell wall biosynthesis
MIGTIVRVARGEGIESVMTRASERVRESWQRRLHLARGTFGDRPRPHLVNITAMPLSARLGGFAVQLRARLDEEKHLREVALFDHGTLEVGSRAWHAESLQMIGAGAFVVEGGFGDIPTLPDGVESIVAIHDFSLISAQRILVSARTVIFPSTFLQDAYRSRIPGLESRVIEPGIPDFSAAVAPLRDRIAFAGSVKPHKGGALIPEIIRGTRRAQWHVFGGGDVELLRAIRATGPVAVHGYYRAHTLPHLLARHRIGLVVLPSIVPETFSLTLSECWSAGVPVVAFDHGAIADRIRAHGGGFLVPLAAGAGGIAACVADWLRGATAPTTPARIPTARDAASVHVALYRELGLL